MSSKIQEIGDQGRQWVRGALTDGDLAVLDHASQMGGSPGIRLSRPNMLSKVISDTGRLTRLAQKFLPGAFPVRVVVFNKSAEANWLLPWHQDRVIAVKDKHAVTGFKNWTKKKDTWHVEPPIDLLQNMIFARVHLDDTDEQNGCLELALGTHDRGCIGAEEAAEIAGTAPQEFCRAKRGDVLIVKALTLHRSKPSKADSDRRTFRVDYCAERLPKPLEWAT